VDPGTYTLEVQAAGERGAWGTPARLTVTVAPFWWETGWFLGLCGLGLIGLAVGAYRWRTRRLRRRRDELAQTVAERTEQIREKNNQLERQAEKLEELDEAKSRFFANVSHEFRTPLTLILGPVRELREHVSRSLSDEDVKKLDTLERNARRLLELVDRLLGIAQMDAGTYRLGARPLDVCEKVRRTVREFVPLANRHEIALTFEGCSRDQPEGDREPVYADPEALERISGNLLSNAIKFTPEEGRVEVSVSTTTEYAEIEVSDTGPGIPPERQSKIFDRFAQAESSGASAQGGTGIGLAYVQDLVELHGGIISVESTQGDGATFTVRLRRGHDHLAQEHLATTDTSPESKSERVGRGESEGGGVELPSNRLLETAELEKTKESRGDEGDMTSVDKMVDKPTVLVVDDNSDIRQHVRSVLTPEFQVVGASDGEEGNVRAVEILPDCILVDQMMPETGGKEMVRRLRANRSTSHIPVLMLTARAETGEEVDSLKAGADDYVTKPFSPKVLRARVLGQIEIRHRLRRRLQAELQGEGGEEAQTEEPFSQEESSTSADDSVGTPDLGPPSLEPPRLSTPAGSGDEDSFVRKVRTAVEEHLADPDLTIGQLANEVATSRSTLYRRLKKKTGQTPSQFISQVRVEYGAQLLREETGTISEIAYAVGFNSLSYFGESFREHVGMSPSEYAEQEE
jgi:signal transduction histidine kinase/AraC-like DNA-binding protein/DNA-binding NarL/FixJ family response regulator